MAPDARSGSGLGEGVSVVLDDDPYALVGAEDLDHLEDAPLFLGPGVQLGLKGICCVLPLKSTWKPAVNRVIQVLPLVELDPP